MTAYLQHPKREPSRARSPSPTVPSPHHFSNGNSMDHQSSSPPWMHSERPATPPSSQPGSGPATPQMIRCSNCSALVPLLELSDHVCRPAAQAAPQPQAAAAGGEARGYDLGRTRQRSAGLPETSQGRASPGSLAAGFQYRQQQRPSTAGNAHNVSDGRSVSASRLAAVPLRVDVVQAQTKGMQQSAAPIPSPFVSPLPRTPASLSPAISPGQSPSGRPYSPHGTRLSPHGASQPRQMPASSSSQPHTPLNGEFRQASPQNGHSPLSISPVGNNAGIGARMPFFEKHQQLFGSGNAQQAMRSNPSPPQSAPPYARDHAQTGGPPPHHTPSHRDVAPAWRERQESSRTPYVQPVAPLRHQPRPQHTMQASGQAQMPSSANAARANGGSVVNDYQTSSSSATSSSAPSVHRHAHSNSNSNTESTSHSHSNSQSSAAHSDHLLSYLDGRDNDTPETSPDISSTARFANNSARNGTARGKPRRSWTDERARNRHGADADGGSTEAADEDDIIDSYPTPQAKFQDRFGGLVIDDAQPVSMAPSNRQGVQHDQPTSSSASSTSSSSYRDSPPKLRIDLELPHVDKPLKVSSPLLRAHSPLVTGTGSVSPSLTRSIMKGLSPSQSTPTNLAQLANGTSDDTTRTPRIGPSKSLNQGSAQRRRSVTDEEAAPSSISRGQRWPKSPMLGPATPRLGLAAVGRSQTHSGLAGTVAERQEAGQDGSAGLGLNSALDDLLSQMNRESVLGGSRPDGTNGSLANARKHSNDAKLEASASGLAGTLDSPIPSPAAASSAARSLPTRVPPHCDSCVRPIPSDKRAIKKDGQQFCRTCYAELYLPKCRKCALPIDGKAIGSGDGKVKGKYHAACFACWECSAPFPSGDFYVFEERPYCAEHYHTLNETLCANPECTQTGIEGACVSLVADKGGRYHPSCFICSDSICTIRLDQYHYILSGLPYCEAHARELEDGTATTPTNGSSSPPPQLNGIATRDMAAGFYQPASSVHPDAITERRRSRSLDAPATSITELRKKAGSPSYFSRHGHNAIANGNGSTAGPGYRSRAKGMFTAGGPPPAASSASAATRRAEKRRTVIQDVSRR